MNRKRESKGIPTGGRFATENRSEADVVVLVTQVRGSDLVPGHTLRGESGGTTSVVDVGASSSQPGMMAVETEHGFLYLDPDENFEVASGDTGSQPDGTVQPTHQDEAEEMVPGQTMVGTEGGTSLIYEVSRSSSHPGFLAVETEHGFFYIDPVAQINVRD